MLAIESAAYYVPNDLLDIETASAWLGISSQQAKIYKRIFGLATFPVAKHLSAYEMIRKALQKLPAIKSTDLGSIKLIIHAHTAQVLCPFGKSVVNEIRKEFGMENALYLGTSLNNCASVFNTFEIAENLLNEFEDGAKALILVGEVTFTQSLRLVPNTSVTGDAAAAMIVNKNTLSNKLIAMTTTCHGEYAKGLWLADEDRIKFETNFSRLLKDVIEQTLSKARLSIQDVSLILPHNVNMHFWQKFAKELNITPATIFTDNIMKYAHCFGADIIMNFVEARNKKRLKRGDYFLMVTSGLGTTLGAALFQC